MPRTKVSKSSKRNREASIREEKIRDFEASLDGYLNQLDSIGQQCMSEVENDVKMLIQRTSVTLLKMKVNDLLALNLDRFRDWNQNSELLGTYTNGSLSLCNSTTSSSLRPAKASNPNDEGYLTEDSCTGGCVVPAYTSIPHARQPSQTSNELRGRTPGPLSSARARRPRRSRSACGDYIPTSALQAKPSATHNSAKVTAITRSSSGTAAERSSRSQLRTPLLRPKAFSADRTPKPPVAVSRSPNSPATAFMRWPKPGELVLSTSGSPVVAQVLPDKFANVNIPVKNGVLSLRPKKLGEIRPDIIEGIDQETLNQIKTLQANLSIIMNIAADQTAAIKK